MTVAVLAGGQTGEREISLATGQAVLTALTERGHRPLLVDVERTAASPRWTCGGTSGSPLALLEGPLAEADVFFLALHGGAGEGGVLQGFLETLGLAYTGSGVEASALCLDKLALLERMEAAGLRSAPRLLLPVEAPAAVAAPPVEAALALEGADGGLVVKPRRGGSSVATTLVRSGAVGELRAAVELVHAEGAGMVRGELTGDDALIEVCVQGVEVSVGVLEDDGGKPGCLPAVEIRPQGETFFDYEQKYDPAGAVELCPAEGLSPAVEARLAQLALLVHRTAGCRGYSRVDFICPPGSRHEGFDEPVLLELNTLPGLTPRSLLPLEARAAGLDFGALCESIAEAGRRAARGCKAAPLAAE